MNHQFPDDPAVLVRKLAELRLEHRDLDTAIARLSIDPNVSDELQITRMKKRKLRLKDMIAWIESRLIPDLDA
ncbi:YdcH family protein [Dokdonella koreensis]|uniref:YdcH family protein n=1 Tax=Dokdonella koreensis TaxID=323415 RepID=UPI00082EE031|nr:YdcH family protein [Dokdonella koreensis]